MLRIGIDLDNTLIHYDRAFIAAAQKRGLLPAGFTGAKQQVRDHLRTLPDGETQWQKLQGHVYGRGIGGARLFDGVKETLADWQRAGHALYIVSHKTEFGHYDEDKVNLREAAVNFLEEQGFFTGGLTRESVSFHPTRGEKVSRIAELALDWFIDDLVEVYEERHFPKTTGKILFHTASSPAPAGDWKLCRNWREIAQEIA